MDRRQIEALLERHRDAFRQLDASALAGTHTAEGIFESPAHGKVVGRSGIEQIYRYWIAAFPDFAFEWREPVIEGDRAALFWNFAGTAKGPFFGVVSAGRRIEMAGAAEYRLATDGIAHARHVFDFSGVLFQTGVLKVKSI
jgi:predicted ester cyclase